ncbi:outer membrane protein assembly factor BamC [Endozoicomonas sp. ISHI1]|uniref:outer membrane protein assembly factor BamC n=2 Tax=unclassified Endozoicomonas TaxID=2644528 RepID=UPI002147A3F9|nr:outer membrane protein assembly factor BamC [Endozoicomonas sp. ISHI1]
MIIRGSGGFSLTSVSGYDSARENERCHPGDCYGAFQNGDRMSRAMKTLPVMACALALTGCANPFGKEGYFRDKSGDYTQARVTRPLEIPEQMNTEPMVESLSIPPISADHSHLESEFDVPRPDQRLTQEEGRVYTIERAGDEEWLLVGHSPDEVWPKLLAFLEENNIPVRSRNVKQGVLETEWTDLGKDPEKGYVASAFSKLMGAEVTGPVEDRFQFEVRQGVKPNSTEVRLRIKSRAILEESQSTTEPKWNNLSERSQKMRDSILNELLLFMVRDDSDKSVSYLAQDLNLGDLAVIEQDGAGNPLLRMDQLSYARSWSAVDAALQQTGVDVTDKNRSAGIFYLQVDPKGVVRKEKESGGWFSGWFGGGEKKETPKEVLLMRVSELNGVVRVSVEKDANTSAPADISRKLLNLVKENLK